MVVSFGRRELVHLADTWSGKEPDGWRGLRGYALVIGLNPIQTAEGTFVLAAIVDITERQRLEREAHRATHLPRLNLGPCSIPILHGWRVSGGVTAGWIGGIR